MMMGCTVCPPFSNHGVWQSTVLSPTRHDLDHGCHLTVPKTSSPGQGSRHGGVHSFLNARQDNALSLSIVPIMHHHNDQFRPNQSIESNGGGIDCLDRLLPCCAFSKTRVADEKVPLEGRIGRVFSNATVRSPR
jgi:hypothetical protein